jgi:hypothetical protein
LEKPVGQPHRFDASSEIFVLQKLTREAIMQSLLPGESKMPAQIRHSSGGGFYAIDDGVKRLTVVTVLILTAFFTGAVRLPAVECAVASAPIGKACHLDCCGNKTCCIESQKKQHGLPKPPLSCDNGPNQQLVAIIPFPCLTSAHLEFPEIETSPPSPAIQFTHGAPKRALLCTFLI